MAKSLLFSECLELMVVAEHMSDVAVLCALSLTTFSGIPNPALFSSSC